MRVLVTRPEEDARRTQERLVALGHAPVVAPLLAVVATGEPPPTGPFAGIVLTSANGAPALARLDGAARARPVFAVGARTAAAARDQGCPDVRAGPGDAAALAALVRREVPAPADLLGIVGRDRKAEPEASLRAAGYRLKLWTAYRADPVAALPEGLAQALAGAGLDAALHYSRRSAETALALAGQGERLATFLALAHLCLSPDVAEPLRAAGADRVLVAAEPNEDALLAALDDAAHGRGARAMPATADGTISRLPTSPKSPDPRGSGSLSGAPGEARPRSRPPRRRGTGSTRG